MNQGTKKIGDWLMRLVKGVFIGSGFILPGVSGGALAAVFGIYERLIDFLSNIGKDFKKNILFFIPVGIGGLLGIVLFSFLLDALLSNYTVYVLWFFIGCIAGTLPTLFRQANKEGHKPKHLWAMGIAAVVAFIVFKLLVPSSTNYSATMPANPIWRTGAWLLIGALIGLGTVVPGFSPSNILYFLGFYGPLLAGFKSFDIAMMIPLFLGVFLCVISLSKVMKALFTKAYTLMYFIIVGIVLASTFMIIPFDYNYLSLGTFFCLGCALLGVGLAYLMVKLEDKYKPEEDF